MNLIVSRRVADTIQLYYHVPGIDIGQPFVYEVTRTVIGMSFPQPAGRGDRTSYGYACVVGERAWYPEEDVQGFRFPSRQFVVLSEIEANSQTDFYRKLIAAKDRYLVKTVVCADRPRQMVDNARNMEGLTRYGNELPHFLKARHPTYVSRKTVAYVDTVSVPELDQMVQFCEALLSAELVNPDNLWPMLGASGKESYRLALPGNLENEKARTAMETPSVYEKVYEAVFLAVRHLENTHRPPQTEPAWKRKGNPITGYAVPLILFGSMLGYLT